jgi:ornithine carbamoyltransferase
MKGAEMAVPLFDMSQGRLAAPDLKSDLDLSTEELKQLLDLAGQMKRTPLRFVTALKNRYLTLLFEKPSLRTRLTFELAMKQLGGDVIVSMGPIGDREPLKDVARNLDRWTQGIVARVFLQDTIEELARWSSVPVINALSDLYHPCQALADFQTLSEHFGGLQGLKLTFVGDGNNVAHSLMLDAARLGVHFTLACPAAYLPNEAIVAQARTFASATGARIEIVHDAVEGVREANAIYTDVWASMGQEKEAEERRQAFAAFQVTRGLLDAASPDAVFLHCLPAKRGQEVTDEVMEHARSVVFDQAENRLHAQKALLLMLLD